MWFGRVMMSYSGIWTIDSVPTFDDLTPCRAANGSS